MAAHKIAVLGAGNGGQALAGHLAMRGHDVSLYDIDREKIRALQSRGQITILGKLEGTVTVKLITASLDEAIADREILFVTTTTDQHISLARQLAPLLTEQQTLILCPGQTGGSIVVRNALLAAGKNNPVAETQDLIYACRAPKPGEVTVSALKLKMAVAVLPDEAGDRVMALLHQILPDLYRVRGPLHIGFNNTGAMLHPTPVVLNAGRIEAGESFLYYRTGITPAVAAAVEAVDRERVAVAAAYGIQAVNLCQWLSDTYGVKGDNLYEMLQNNAAYANIKSVPSLQNRFLTEDTPSGLVPLEAFGQLAGVVTPVMTSVINLANELLGQDFRAVGRNLKCLGLEGLSVSEIKEKYV